jgi:endonuclease III
VREMAPGWKRRDGCGRLTPDMAPSHPHLGQVLDALENLYGPQKAAGPTDPYEMILFLNCGYPATDATCAKGFVALKREVGLAPDEILAASQDTLATLMRLGGIVPEQRAERLKAVARVVHRDCGGDLKATLKQWMREEKQRPGHGIRCAKKLLQQFPVIGEPSAEKILLFAKLAPVAAVPSACVGVPLRLWRGDTGTSYSADYRKAREILSAGLPESFEARQRAHLLLKKHGQEICKRATPRCEVCPVTAHCAYLRARAAD